VSERIRLIVANLMKRTNEPMLHLKDPIDSSEMQSVADGREDFKEAIIAGGPRIDLNACPLKESCDTMLLPLRVLKLRRKVTCGGH